jgi:predicted unusual protein kinase regulating ubiquinone biosynthesis (AarF/ABC1/UbiB family)
MRTPDGKIVILDFGLTTEVAEEQRIALVEYIAHLTCEDWEAVSNDLVLLGKWGGLGFLEGYSPSLVQSPNAIGDQT